jgi:hypothetical protein
MEIFTIVSAVPVEHYKHQKGFDVVMEKVIRGKQKSQTKIWMPEAQYNLMKFMQDAFVLDNLRKKDAEKFLELLEEFGQEKYYQGSSDEAMSNSEDL